MCKPFPLSRGREASPVFYLEPGDWLRTQGSSPSPCPSPLLLDTQYRDREGSQGPYRDREGGQGQYRDREGSQGPYRDREGASPLPYRY